MGSVVAGRYSCGVIMKFLLLEPRTVLFWGEQQSGRKRLKTLLSGARVPTLWWLLSCSPVDLAQGPPSTHLPGSHALGVSQRGLWLSSQVGGF